MTTTRLKMLQTMRRVAWSNPVALKIATSLVDASYVVRTKLFGAGAKPQAKTELKAGLPETYARWQTQFGDVPGAFFDGAIVTWDVLLTLQRERGQKGPILEIGVLRGRSATLLAVHAAGDELLVLVDPAMRMEAVDAVRSAHPENNLVLKAKSQDILDDPQLQALQGKFRWIHIDGEHSGPAVVNDLDLAARLLATDGLICLDDFFASSYPQITRAAFAWLERSGGAFELILTGYNKGYICRREAAQAYLQFMKDHLYDEMERRDFPKVTIWKTAAPSDMNCFGIVPSFRAYKYKGPDMAPDRIEI